ncbi:ABC transporter ATP-binding protein/permease [Lachnoclostridium phytofermentans]|uniref:ABC transporter related n=1 Tax=Lachnoclostridium phytofermentans (strain ATCC 700394 / DSM 18823 / ISDg) TaxID=357809 RepID=A9KRB2_LACP7|nr:ABC transporter ATP-binding protein/permease [Lachnoclostridium phytofermentans]ABX40580.1 ABC transporter related [Lachnoclostridium phytofermentans ISDg]
MFLIRNVSKQFGDEYALRNISMTIGKGLNFIIGSSGSGKTTLLKIISGMEQKFDGEVFYCGQDVKALTEQEKSYYYNNIFGFVWQDFNLLDDLTVLENIMLPQFLKHGQDKKAIMKVLRELKISELDNQKVGKLSGGQKQRVAIARELMKNPQVIIADEPTSALDEKSSKTTMDILRDIAKNRTVIVVTHDTSLIDQSAKVYELDKGELTAATEEVSIKEEKADTLKPHKLSFASACKLSLSNIKSKWNRTITTALSLVVAATLLLVTVSGAITDSSQSAFDKLFETYGESILDISIVGSFMSAGGTDGSQKDEPNANVDQNIDGLYDKYLNDKRVSHIVFTQHYNDIKVSADGKEYSIDTGSSVPTVNKLIAGKMPMGEDNEIVVPKSFIEKLGVSAEEALGKTIDFKGNIYNWDSGEPVSMPVSTTANIVGVVDTTVKYEYGGQLMEYSVDDAFFFSRSALNEMRTQADIKNGEGNFTIRTKTPADLIAIKDELNAEGIVPLGRFELVEDMVRLNDQTTEQSGSAILVIGILAAVIILSVSLMTALTRRREYAIFKVSGYANQHLLLMTASEFMILAAASGILFLCISPLINLATTALWSVNILNGNLLFAGVLLVLVMGILACTTTTIAGIMTKASASLKTGDR